MNMAIPEARRLCKLHADWVSCHWYSMFSSSDYVSCNDYSYSFGAAL